MTATQIHSQPGLASRLINTILSIKPIADLAKFQARNMMIKRAERLGVPWRENVKNLRSHDWQKERSQVENSQVIYPDYYLCSFHAYDNGNLNWDAALELESAAYAVHSMLWNKKGDINGDFRLRQSYHQILKEQLSFTPQAILDLGCGVGMSTFPLQEMYPQAQVTGLDLSPYHLSVAHYRSQEKNPRLNWVHGAAEKTGLPDGSFDLVSACLMFHELPQIPAKEIFQEARRLLRRGGYFTIMDMNPQSEVFKKMPPYILTLLKSTEPYLDEYFTLDIEQALMEAGFQQPTITFNTPRHRTIIAQVTD